MKSIFVSFLVCALSCALWTGCEKGESVPMGKGTNPPPAVNNVDYLGAVGKAQKQAERVADTASVQQAINHFHAQEDRNPENLQEVVTEKYLPKLPELPSGYKYTYDPQSGKVKAVPVQN